MRVRPSCALVIAGAAVLAAGPAQAAPYTNIAGIVVEFPGGAISFADAVVDHSPGLVADPDGVSNPLTGATLFPAGTIVPLPLALNADMVLGPPDLTFATAQTCTFSFAMGNPDWVPGCNFASLGVGGSLTVQFTDNFLIGDGTDALDLWIFETGPDIEDTFVDISKNGVDWFNVGKVGGSTSGVDIDFFGFGPSDLFRFVRLTDDPNEGETDGGTVGADIDAIGAISTTAVPLPATAWLLLTGVGTFAIRRRLRRGY